MKKYILLAITIITFCIPAFASAAQAKQLQYSLEGAVKTAVDNSKQAKLDDFSIRTKEKALQKINETFTVGGVSDTKESILAYEIKVKINPKQAQLDLDNAKHTKQENLYNLKLDVYKSVSNIALVKKELDNKSKKLDSMNVKYKQLLAKNKAGDMTSSDVLEMEVNINTMKNEKKDLEEKLTSSYVAFKKLLNLALDGTPVSINFDISYSPFIIADINDYVLRAQNSSLTVYTNQKKLEMEQDTMALTAKYYKSGEYEYDNENLNLENSQSDLDDSKKAIEVNVKNGYNNLLNLQDKVEIAQSYLILMETRLKNAELKYKKGFVSKEALLNIQDSYADALFQKDSAVNSYNIAAEELKSLVKDQV